jgi:hypothetical protein
LEIRVLQQSGKLVAPTVLFVFLIFSPRVDASLPIHRAGADKKSNYITSGVFVGGRDQGKASMVALRHGISSELGIERLVIDTAALEKTGSARPLNVPGRPGFFHVSVQENPRRLLIELEGVVKTQVSPRKLLTETKKSEFLGAPVLFVDSINQSTTIEIPMTKKAQVEVFELANPEKPGRIVIDIKSAS